MVMHSGRELAEFLPRQTGFFRFQTVCLSTRYLLVGQRSTFADSFIHLGSRSPIINIMSSFMHRGLKQLVSEPDYRQEIPVGDLAELPGDGERVQQLVSTLLPGLVRELAGVRDSSTACVTQANYLVDQD